jgi:hypothetical protein
MSVSTIALSCITQFYSARKMLALLAHSVVTSTISFIYLTVITIIIISLKGMMTMSVNLFFFVEQ